jgi:23S rRNA (cytosine1962-C5)-methyltransferase
VKTRWINAGLLTAFEAEKTNAHRLATASDGWVERFGDDVLVSFKCEAARDRLIEEFNKWAERTGFAAKRIFARFLPRENVRRVAPKLIGGDANSDSRGVVLERGLRFGVDFGAGYSVGLFIDQRENRSVVRRLAPKKMLNCFAYTGSFSLASASAGARTLSIDLSRKSLDRARENFALNNLNQDGHRFFAEDVLEVVPRLARKQELFDLIVIDPPTFSRSRSGKTFHVQSDFESLLIAILELAQRGAHILLSTNCSRLDDRKLELMARFCLKTCRRGGTFYRAPRPVEFPSGSAASSVWLTLR